MIRVTTEKLVNRNPPINVRTNPTSPNQPARGAWRMAMPGTPSRSSNPPIRLSTWTKSQKLLRYWCGSLPEKRAVDRMLPMIPSTAPRSRASPLAGYNVADDIVHNLLAVMSCAYKLQASLRLIDGATSASLHLLSIQEIKKETLCFN